jgi:hypothetical protein
MYNFDTFNWRAINPGLSVPVPVADYLDIVCELVRDNIPYYHRAVQNCDVFDTVHVLTWLRDNGHVTGADEALWKQAHDALLANRNVYMTAAEVEGRMKAADGACPFCGFQISYSTEENDRGGSFAFSRCSHWRFDYVGQTDQSVMLRHPKSWAGKRWPYSWDRKIARDDGSPLMLEMSLHCNTCRTADAHRIVGARVHQFLIEAVEKAQTPGWSNPGWSHACSATVREERSLERMARDIVTDDSHEFRLNGAGLKLYTRGVKVGIMRREVQFNMRVGGDQASAYPEFVEWANNRLAELKLTEDALAAA